MFSLGVPLQNKNQSFVVSKYIEIYVVTFYYTLKGNCYENE